MSRPLTVAEILLGVERLGFTVLSAQVQVELGRNMWGETLELETRLTVDAVAVSYSGPTDGAAIARALPAAAATIKEGDSDGEAG